MITVEHYWPLTLLLAVPVVWWISRRTALGLASRHLRAVASARSVVVVLLTLALMQPVWHRAGRWLSTVYLLDVSSSVDAGFLGAAIQWIADTQQQGSPAHAAYLAFASRAERVEGPQDIRSLEVSVDGGADGLLDRDATDLEYAVREAIRSFDPRYLKRLVLITDGNGTTGDVASTLGRLQEEGIRVFTLPATVGRDGDAFVDDLVLPAEVRADEPVAAEVGIVSRTATPATVELYRGEDLLEAVQTDLQPGLNSIRIEFSLSDTGTTDLRARVRAEGDPFAANDAFARSVVVGERPRVLYVEGRQESVRYLRDALRGEGLEVGAAVPGRLPTDPRELQAWDAVILSDVPASVLDIARMRALETYVRDFGGGLIFAAGENTYGEEGFSETPVEEILPVSFRIEEERKDLALVIVMDKSFSMVGAKIELSKEAAKAALQLLDDTHRFGVITFDHSPYWTVPLQFAVDKPRLNELISSIIASAHTNIYPALERAYRALADTEADVKHVILLSDGKTYPDDYETLVNGMSAEEITVSTVAVGEQADQELLSNIAEWGNGRSYFIRDAERVPQIFIDETRMASQRTLVEEDFDLVVRRRIEAFRGIDFASAPDLKGFVSTEAKQTAEVLLEATDEAPLLARWQYGLGKTAVFTSDVKNRWAVDWLEWQGYGKFWAQLVRETLRRSPGEALDFEVRREGKRAVVSLDALDDEGYFQNELTPRVRVAAPDGSVSVVTLRQVGPGAYRAEVPLAASSSAPWTFRLESGLPPSTEGEAMATGERRPGEATTGPEGSADRAGAAAQAGSTAQPGSTTEALPPDQTVAEEAQREMTRALYYPYPDEHRFYPPDLELLRGLAEQTGGSFVPDPGEIFADHGDTARVPTPLWPWLAGLGLVAYLLDIALRRAPWSWRWLGSAGAGAASTSSGGDRSR